MWRILFLESVRSAYCVCERIKKKSDSLSCLNLFMHLDWIERKMWAFVSLDDATLSLSLSFSWYFPHECFFLSLCNILSYCSLSSLILLEPLSLSLRKRQQHVLPLAFSFFYLRHPWCQASFFFFFFFLLNTVLFVSILYPSFSESENPLWFLSFFLTSFLHFLHWLQSMSSIPRKSKKSSSFCFLFSMPSQVMLCSSLVLVASFFLRHLSLVACSKKWNWVSKQRMNETWRQFFDFFSSF